MVCRSSAMVIVKVGRLSCLGVKDADAVVVIVVSLS